MKKILISMILAGGIVLCTSSAKAANNYNLTPEIASAYFNIVDSLAEKHGNYVLKAGNLHDENGFEKHFWDARLIDFDNNKVPELFFIYDSDYIDYDDVVENAIDSSQYQVWGWNGSNAYQIVKGNIRYTGNTTSPDLSSIFTEDGKSYLNFTPHYQIWDYFADGRGMATEKFYTIKNGKWVEAKEKELYYAPYAPNTINYKFELLDATIGGKSVSSDEMKNRLNYVMGNSINIWWNDIYATKFIDFANEINMPFKVQSNVQTIMVDGKPVDLKAYNVGGSNYMRLRDIAAIMRDTKKPFDVQWLDNKVSVILNKKYNGDKKPAIPESGIGKRNVQWIFYLTIDEYNSILNETSDWLTTYYLDARMININDENYVKLRDIASCINFYVDWDSNTNTIIINSSNNYSV